MAGETEKRTIEIVVNGQKVNASLKEMDAAAAVLYNQFKKLSADDPGRAKLLQDYRDLKERVGDVRKELGQVKESASVFQQAMAFAGVTVGAEAIIDGIKELGAEVIQTTKEVQTLRSSINGLTGATGAELDGLTSSVMAVARTFGKDFNEVLVASNSLSKTMGVSQQEAMRLIEQGFLSGADASGEFLDQVKEYGPQFKAAGVSANEAIGIISQSVTGGIFSDKGADVVKEFGLRITEQTKSTKDALYAAFGPEFTKEILEGVNSGSMTSIEALRRISQEMNDTKIPASQLQTVVADVFGGPGEDAGLDYLKSLRNVGGGVDELVDKTNVYVQRQREQLRSEKELADAQNELAKAFEGGGTMMSTVTNRAMTVLYTLLVSLGATFRELAEPVQRIWASLLDLGQSLGLISQEGTTAKGVGEALGAIFRLIFAPTKALWGVLADITVALVEWAKKSELARAALQVMTAPVRTLYALLTNGPAYFAGFSAAAEASFGVIGRAWQRILNRDFAGAKAEFGKIGTTAGEEYNRAFAAALAAGDSSASASATSSNGGNEAPTRRAAGTGMTEADEAKADKDREARLKKVAAAQDKADLARLKALQAQVALEMKLEDARVLAIEDDHEREIAGVRLKYRRKAALVEGTEAQQQQQLMAIRDEQNRELAALSEKYQTKADEDAKTRFEKSLLDEDAAQQDRELAIQVMFDEMLLSEESRDLALYESKRRSLEAKLEMEAAHGGKTTTLYMKTRRELTKLEKEHNKEIEDNTKKREKAKMDAVDMTLKFGSAALQTTIDILFQDEAARKKHHNMYTALSGAKLIMDGAQEVAAIWRYAAENPANGPTGGTVGAIIGALQTGLAVARTTFALTKLQKFSFAEGGRTGAGMMAGAQGAQAFSNMMNLSDMRVGASGRLVDNTGFAVAGIVHEDEYVIPKWMRADPQVLAVESWLEARRLRGYAEGGATTDGGGRRMVADLLPTGSATTETVQLLQDILVEQRLQNARIDQWQRELEVKLSLQELQKSQQQLSTLKAQSAIRKGD
ncbi:phage tail tape measure protein [Hymenobacter psychrotolerans]|uniref:Phage-related minor tail protein n=1 Tax=Hymenobacter psychrotolerans DSM 18569 TaxID=1121959 RepID=A0A1M6Z5S5_9BACT|nr:phage tail tape measure protein [Hymenobacter psychrotolerans]SHL25790.1 Phage-related minor tail protein [Hymenobacter psychrotolerans DSM 18569]